MYDLYVIVPVPLSASRSPHPLRLRRDLRRSTLRLSQYTCFSHPTSQDSILYPGYPLPLGLPFPRHLNITALPFYLTSGFLAYMILYES